MAERRAILIGVDGYSFAPLGSAVNDARAMRDALLSRSTPELEPIFVAEEIKLLVTPGSGGALLDNEEPATRSAILSALKGHYEKNDPVDFLLVFFAGHGMVASPDGRTRESLILPSDVSGPEDGRNMISLTELMNLFAERGPRQQLWIADACRDMPYTHRPRGYMIEWTPRDPQGPRAQVGLFAVAKGGSALSSAGGQGRVTEHLINGLKGKGCAADYIPGTGYCVTAQSLHEYAQRRVAEALKGYDDWTRTVQMPQIDPNAALAPLRKLLPLQPHQFAVTVRPPEAEHAIGLSLEVQMGIPVAGWPPVAPPRIYELRAVLHPGMEEEGWATPRPELMCVDLREDERVAIDVPRRTAAGATVAAPRSTTGEHGIARAETVSQTPQDPSVHFFAPPPAVLTVEAADPVAHVRVRRAQSPWTEIEGRPNIPIELNPGVWDVEVVLGDEAISATRVVLHHGERRNVRAVAQITPATASLLKTATSSQGAELAPATLTVSESIGPMQGAILPTLLPLLALKPYDTEGFILRHLTLGIPLDDGGPGPRGFAPFSAALAVEGETAPERLPVVRGARKVWASADGRVTVFTALKRDSGDTAVMELGERVFNVAVPHMPGGVTVVGATFWPDGRFDVSVDIFALPVGTFWDPNSAHVPTGRIARALALATRLFRGGASLDDASDFDIQEIAHAKWIDPVLGALAFHAHEERLAKRESTGTPLRTFRDTIRHNLSQHFPQLPDSRIIAALHDDKDARRSALLALLEEPGFPQPVLTASLAYLVRAALEAGRESHWAIERFDRVSPGQVFNAIRTK